MSATCIFPAENQKNIEYMPVLDPFFALCKFGEFSEADFYNAPAAILCSGRTRNIFYDMMMMMMMIVVMLMTDMTWEWGLYTAETVVQMMYNKSVSER